MEKRYSRSYDKEAGSGEKYEARIYLPRIRFLADGHFSFRSCGDVQVQLETVAVVATVTQQRRVLVSIGSAQTINCRRFTMAKEGDYSSTVD
jgi:hypothetical protein